MRQSASAGGAEGPARIATALVAVLAAAILAWPPAPASAISRDRAERIALRELKPGAKRLGARPVVAIFGLRRALGPRAVVTEGGRPRKAKRLRTRRVRTVRRLGRRAWLFWRDSAYGARFSHRSRLLLVSDRNGKVFRSKRLRWWPLVNGRKPPFLRTQRKYLSKRFRIYSDFKRVASSSSAARAEPRFGAAAAAPPAPSSSHETFAADCMLTVVGDDQRFARDVKAMEGVVQGAGIRTFRLESRRKGEPPDASDLRNTITKVVHTHGCKDVLLYLIAHGDEAGNVFTGERVEVDKGSDPGKAKVKTTTVAIAGNQLTQAIGDQVLDATFKVKVDVCYAGLQLPLINLPNVLVVEVGSGEGEPTWFALQGDVRRGSDGEPFAIVNRNNPDRLSEFTNRNVVGMRRFFGRQDEIQYGMQQAQAQNTSYLAWILSRAFALGENADFAATLGRTDPKVQTKFQQSAPP